MNILVLDTSTSILSMALKTDESYEERLIDGHFSHSEDLLPEIESFLSRAGIDIADISLVIVAKGPGSFTGLRIAMASAKGLASALSIPLVSVPTLDVIAMAASPWDGPVLSCIDARKRRFYLQLRKGGSILVPDRDGNAEDIAGDIASAGGTTLVTGPDAKAFAEKLTAAGASGFMVDEMAPRCLGRALIALAERKLAEQGPDDIGEGPVYIRRSDAEEALLRKMEGRNDG